MSNNKITILNVETNELIEREMNPGELAQYEADQLEAAEVAAKTLEAKAKKQTLLDKLGITEDEAKLLLS